MPWETPELLKAVHELRDQVAELVDTLKDYPKRSEIRKGRLRFAGAVLVGLVVSALVGSFMTVLTVSGCFLSRAAADGHAASVCGVLPGYSAAQERNARTYERFMRLLSDIETNDRKIEKLQHEVDAQGKAH